MNQKTRQWIDSLFLNTRDSLAQKILQQYKIHHPKINHLKALDADFRDYKYYKADDFANDQAVLQIDLTAWISLLSRKSSKHFLSEFQAIDRRRLVKLRSIRNQWAHQQHISREDVQIAAEISIELLRAFGSKDVGLIQGIMQEIQLHDTDCEEVTQAIQPIRNIDHYYIEVIEINNQTHSRRLQLKSRRQIIGRSIRSDIPLEGDPAISRWHLLLSQGADGMVRLLDLCSRNGTLLEDQAVKSNNPVPWPVGTRVQIGGTWMILRQGEA